jgi:FHA domain-containing protein
MFLPASGVTGLSRRRLSRCSNSRVRPDCWLTLPDGADRELEGTLAIGRAPENDVVLESVAVSREHAALVHREGRWYLEDRGSYNGTFLNGARVNPASPMPLRHADRIDIGGESLVFSCPTQLDDPEVTEPLERGVPTARAQLSPFQRQVVQCLCNPWLAGASLDNLPSNEEIAAMLGTPGATGTVKAALRRVYAKAGLSDRPAHAKRRALCRVARRRGWV